MTEVAVVVGIDGGGTSTRARAEAADGTVLAEEMGLLADILVRHLDRHRPPAHEDRVGLAGGLWDSPAASVAFRGALRERGHDHLVLVQPVRSPAAAAIALLRSP